MAYNMKGFSGFGSPLQKRGPKEIVEEHTSKVSKKSTKIDSTKVTKNKSLKNTTSGSGAIAKGATNTISKISKKIGKRVSRPSIDQTFIPSETGTIRERFNTAFSSARSAGKKTFEFEGKMYTTKIK